MSYKNSDGLGVKAPFGWSQLMHSNPCIYSQLTGLGTDLKLPRIARAAVTLGPRLTKDRLEQGESPLIARL